MESIERPQKPQLDYEFYTDGNGVLVKQLTAESELVWSRYLHADHLARAAIWKAQHAAEEEEVSSRGGDI